MSSPRDERRPSDGTACFRGSSRHSRKPPYPRRPEGRLRRTPPLHALLGGFNADHVGIFERAQHGVASRGQDFVGFGSSDDFIPTTQHPLGRAHQLFSLGRGLVSFAPVPHRVDDGIDVFLLTPALRFLEEPSASHALTTRPRPSDEGGFGYDSTDVLTAGAAVYRRCLSAVDSASSAGLDFARKSDPPRFERVPSVDRAHRRC
jgi:hypothetical protein